jgi:hypothetical protein
MDFGINNGSIDPANVDNIEVIKGPSGTLFWQQFDLLRWFDKHYQPKVFKIWGNQL